MVSAAATSRQEGCGFDSKPGTSLCAGCMFFLRLLGSLQVLLCMLGSTADSSRCECECADTDLTLAHLGLVWLAGPTSPLPTRFDSLGASLKEGLKWQPWKHVACKPHRTEVQTSNQLVTDFGPRQLGEAPVTPVTLSPENK